MDRDHHRFICDCIKKLTPNTPQPSPHILPLRGDVFRYIKSCKQQFDFIFADPPYALKELPTIPGLIFERGMLKEGGILVFEHGKENDFSNDPRFVEHRTYGSVNFSIFRN
jgi:16S rRNA G966 N2-methylase RsmD